MQNNSKNSKLRVISTVEVKEGKRQELLDILVPFVKIARKKEGNISYDIYSSTENPNEFLGDHLRMVLTYDAYSETLENQKEKEDRLTIIENQMKALLSTLGNIKDQRQVNQMARTLYSSGILKDVVNDNE